MIDAPKLDLSERQLAEFRTDGFLVVPSVLDAPEVAALRNSFPRIFSGDFDTGIYPDEWHWREGMSLPDITRHICNAWKSDLAIARLALSETIGRVAAQLTGWPGVRLGQDTIWWKPPGTRPIKLHQDSSFMDFLEPAKTITCWVALDDTARDAGTLEYAPGSHLWPLTKIPGDFHTAEDYRSGMRYAAQAAGVPEPTPYFVEVPAGSLAFHAGEIWHGSGPNTSGTTMRRSIGLHMISTQARFSDRPGGYIYRRYQITGDPDLNESFFPTIWTGNGERTGWIEDYCRSGVRQPANHPARGSVSHS